MMLYLSVFSRFFPHSRKLVFTHFSSDDINKEDAIAIATLYPDITELVVGELAVVEEPSLAVVGVLGGPGGKRDVDGPCADAVAGVFYHQGARGGGSADGTVSCVGG